MILLSNTVTKIIQISTDQLWKTMNNGNKFPLSFWVSKNEGLFSSFSHDYFPFDTAIFLLVTLVGAINLDLLTKRFVNELITWPC